MSRFPWLRSLLLLTSAGLVIGLMLGLLDRTIQLYRFLALTSPLLAAIVVTLLVGALAAVLIALWRYTRLFQHQPSTKRPEPVVSEDKVEAASESLTALQAQVEKIQDEVLRQALLTRSEALFESLERDELLVVVFGTGSAGKTSLVNCLLGRHVGEVAATMGTTTIGERYAPVRLAGVRSPLAIVDCPGILEAGVAGTEREQLARQLATESDLLLFVVDGDLQASEYGPLHDLVLMGKRSLLVLNKMDRLIQSDREALLEHLRQRVAPFLETRDVVAIAARPATLTLDTGEQMTPEPKLKPLLRRMTEVLNREGDDLVADNVLLQSHRLNAEIRDVLQSERRDRAEKIVVRFQWLVVAAIFATPLPAIDLLATAAINAQMVVELGKIYGCEVSLEQGKELAGSLAKTLVSLGIVKGVTQIVTAPLSLTVVGHLLKATVQAVTGAYLTRIAGNSFIEFFSQDRNWGDAGIAAVVERQFQLNRRDEFVKSFIQDALTRVLSLPR